VIWRPHGEIVTCARVMAIGFSTRMATQRGAANATTAREQVMPLPPPNKEGE
jgi:hypothetical protein